jgi:hypothetical protein
MELQFNFVVDKTIKGKIYPALSRHEARPYTQSWRQFGDHWPYTTPVRLQEYCDQHGVAMRLYDITDAIPDRGYYPICIGFFDFSIDYFSLLPPAIVDAVKTNRLKIGCRS